ncbi:glycosyltransferase family 4 protein [Providencia rettgeri]|nr:glycosyltransferase family 4 protein [Providencia rettgeri]MDK3009196.1 glycosyltransferase family 4 protein [Providencia rettgeri]
MNLLVTVERRYKEYNNDFYVKGIEDNIFFKRYLTDFKKVYVVARVSKVNTYPIGFKKVNSNKIIFLPIYSEGYGILKLSVISSIIKKTRNHDCKIIIRTPGLLAYSFSLYCFFLKAKFNLEVVTDPYEEAINSTRSSILNKVLGKVFPLIFKFQLKNCQFASFVTKNSIQDKYLTNYIESEKFNSSYSSINLSDDFYREKNIEPRNIDDINLLFVGVLDRDFKGLDIFLKILHQLPKHYKAKVVGDGILLNSYKELAQTLEISDRTTFLGYISDEEEKQNIYFQSDIFVLTSRREGLPRVVIEAMANSLPCICSDVSGIRELIPQNYIFPINNIELACQLIKRMTAEDMLTQGKINFQTAKEYSISKIVPQRSHFYQKIIFVDKAQKNDN